MADKRSSFSAGSPGDAVARFCTLLLSSMFLVIFFVVISSPSFALSGGTADEESMVFFDISVEEGVGGEHFSINSVDVVNYVDVFHYTRYTTHGVPDAFFGGDLVFSLEDASGNILFSSAAAEPEGYIMFLSVADSSRLKIFSEGILVFEQAFSFCDEDGLCESSSYLGSATGDFFTAENTLSCIDCSSGVKDGYCDELEDGVCDPDCRGFADFDCGPLCDGIGGDVCSYGDDCIGGSFVETYDSALCCMGGTCGDVDEFVAYSVSAQNQPVLTITSSGERVSSVMGGSVSLCMEDMGGEFCSPDEYCMGEYVASSEVGAGIAGPSCCLGGCVRYSSEEFGSDYPVVDEEFYGAAEVSLEDEEMFYDIGPEDLEISEDDESFEPIDEHELALLESEQDFVYGPSIVHDDSDPAKYIKDAGLDWRLLLAASAVVILLVATIVVISRRRSRQILAVSDNRATEDSLVRMVYSWSAKGYGERQVREFLLRKGYDAASVDSALSKVYGRRSL